MATQNRGRRPDNRTVVTKGTTRTRSSLYGTYWAYRNHEDIRQEIHDGVGGVVGALLYFFVGIVTLFLLPLEIKRMYEAKGLPNPVSAGTAFWVLLFVIPWYVKCQAALNQYWAATATPQADVTDSITTA